MLARRSFQPLVFFVSDHNHLLFVAAVRNNLTKPASQQDKSGDPPLKKFSAGPPPPRRDPERVALCFFGLARSLRWTLASIHARVIDVLQEAGLEVDVFVHTYNLEEVKHKLANVRIHHDMHTPSRL